jgi:hypothetical protein
LLFFFFLPDTNICELSSTSPFSSSVMSNLRET